MSFASRLIHSLTITRASFSTLPASDDAYGQPTRSTSTESVAGLVQPKTAQEIADSRSSGAEVGTFTIFLAPMELDGADSITHNGELYSIKGIRSFQFGSSPHLEVDANRVGPVAEVVGS